MKINNKGYVSTVIIFSLLIIFLIIIFMLIQTMNNSRSLNKNITNKVTENIDYDSSGTIQERVSNLEKQLVALQEENKTLSDKLNEVNNQFNNKAYIKPTVSNSNIVIHSGGYVKKGNIVIVNIDLTINASNISKDVNSPTEIFKGLPKPISSSPVLIAQTPKVDGSSNSVRLLNARIYSNGTMVMSDSPTTPYNAGWGITIAGTYITSE